MQACEKMAKLSYLFWFPYSEVAKYASELSNELSCLKETIDQNQKNIDQNQKKLDEKMDTIEQGKFMEILINQNIPTQNTGFLSSIVQQGNKANIELYPF